MLVGVVEAQVFTIDEIEQMLLGGCNGEASGQSPPSTSFEHEAVASQASEFEIMDD